MINTLRNPVSLILVQQAQRVTHQCMHKKMEKRRNKTNKLEKKVKKVSKKGEEAK